MAFNIVVGGVVRHVMYCTIPGQISVTKRDWQCTSIAGGANVPAQAVVDDFDTAAGTAFGDAMSNDAQYYGSQLYYQTPVGPPPRPVTSIAGATAGVDISPLLPTQTCGLVSLYSDFLGKAGQGRVYVPFPAISSQDTNGTPTPLYNTVVQNIGTFLTTPRVVVSGGISATFVPSLYIPGGSPPKPLISFQVRDAWATQRRRGSFGRLNRVPF